MLKRAIVVGSVLIAIAGSLRLLREYDRDIRAWLYGPLPPLRNEAPPAGREIMRKRELELIGKAAREYGRVKAAVDAARAKGLPVDHEERNLAAALDMARAGRYDQALTLLNRIELDIPRKKESLIPAQVMDGVKDDPEMRASPVERKTKRRHRRRPGRAS